MPWNRDEQSKPNEHGCDSSIIQVMDLKYLLICSALFTICEAGMRPGDTAARRPSTTSGQQESLRSGHMLKPTVANISTKNWAIAGRISNRNGTSAVRREEGRTDIDDLHITVSLKQLQNNNGNGEIVKTAANSSLPNNVCMYTVVTVTGTQVGAGTNSDISLRLANEEGDEVYLRHLANGHRAFERGHTDTFLLPERPCVIGVCRMVLSTDDRGPFSEWFVVRVETTVTAMGNDGAPEPGPSLQQRWWEINEWLPEDDEAQELYTVRDDCARQAANRSIEQSRAKRG